MVVRRQNKRKQIDAPLAHLVERRLQRRLRRDRVGAEDKRHEQHERDRDDDGCEGCRGGDEPARRQLASRFKEPQRHQDGGEEREKHRVVPVRKHRHGKHRGCRQRVGSRRLVERLQQEEHIERQAGQSADDVEVPLQIGGDDRRAREDGAAHQRREPVVRHAICEKAGEVRGQRQRADQQDVADGDETEDRLQRNRERRGRDDLRQPWNPDADWIEDQIGREMRRPLRDLLLREPQRPEVKPVHVAPRLRVQVRRHGHVGAEVENEGVGDAEREGRIGADDPEMDAYAANGTAAPLGVQVARQDCGSRSDPVRTTAF